MQALAWAALIILLPVALLGFTMFARWIGVYRGTGTTSPPAARASGQATARAAPVVTATPAAEVIPAERHLPSRSSWLTARSPPPLSCSS